MQINKCICKSILLSITLIITYLNLVNITITSHINLMFAAIHINRNVNLVLPTGWIFTTPGMESRVGPTVSRRYHHPQSGVFYDNFPTQSGWNSGNYHQVFFVRKSISARENEWWIFVAGYYLWLRFFFFRRICTEQTYVELRHLRVERFFFLFTIW